MKLRALVAMAVSVAALMWLGGRALAAQARRQRLKTVDLGRWEDEGGTASPEEQARRSE
jgi:hypothetical protein